MTATGGASAATDAGTLDANLWVDYIYLDTDERRRFAQVSHEYLIEQLQFNGDEAFSTVAADQTQTTLSISLNLNHPVKELVWVGRVNAGAGNAPQLCNYTTHPAAPAASSITGIPTAAAAAPTADIVDLRRQNMVNPVYGNSPRTLFARNITAIAKLQLNGHDRFAQRDGTYFNRVQTFDAHTCIPESPGINVYSFALKPEEHQPSGTCNFSRIDNAKLQLGLNLAAAGVIKVFATNYNVLRVMSGMGGLAYSN